MKVVSGKEFCKALKKQGWRLDRVKGSHHCYKHPNSNQLIVVPVHGNQDLKKGFAARTYEISRY